MGLYYLLVVCFFLIVLCSDKTGYELQENGSTGVYYHRKYQKKQRIIFFIGMCVLFVLTGFRSENIGNDTRNYIYYFNYFMEYGVDSSTNIEIGYQFYCYIIGKVTNDPHVFLIITALISYGVIGITIYKHSNNLGFSLCLFFCLFFSLYTNTIRQGISIVILLVAYFLIKEGHCVKAVLAIFFASLFHTTSILMLALVLYRYIPIKPKVVFLFVIGMLVASISGVLTTILIVIVPSHYQGYFESVYASSGWLAVTVSLLRNLFFYWIAYHSYKKAPRPADQLILANMTILLMLNSLGFVVNLFTRAAECFSLVMVIELPNLLQRKGLPNRRFVIIGLSFVLLLYFIVILLLRPEWNHLYPYAFWGQ